MLALRDAQLAVDMWRGRIHALERAVYAVAITRDHVALDQHLADLEAARSARDRAVQELRIVRGIITNGHRRPVAQAKPATPHRRSVPARAIAHSSLVLKAVDSERREISGWATKPEIDRLGDIVDPLGATFRTPLPLLHQHDSRAPVGQVYSAKASKDGIAIRAKLATVTEPGPLKDPLTSPGPKSATAWFPACR